MLQLWWCFQELNCQSRVSSLEKI